MKLKPYMLVEVYTKDHLVEGGQRFFVGEVMSMPTPQSTVMVRTVPGHPGTLVEVPISECSLPRRRYKYVHYAIVNGSGSFPTDMLRYDSCVPVNFKLVESFHGAKAVLLPNMGDELLVADVSDNLHPSWTKARWSSFLWGLRELKTERIGEEQ